MDFIRYAERSAALVNAELPDEAALRAHLADRSWLHRSVVPADVTALQASWTFPVKSFGGLRSTAGSITAASRSGKTRLSRCSAQKITDCCIVTSPNELRLAVKECQIT